ncbi:ABC transporter substrate-binding protein [Ensifer adhaerens]|nr:ABC transporter substrate-binding protein [Ensifer adhaerens]UAY05071.1 ABC transporter substrate-binding protein [Ensifer adhaerens]UAY12491.1 ABC transporter substrate-binding protein [Ensifer adhaerens]
MKVIIAGVAVAVCGWSTVLAQPAEQFGDCQVTGAAGSIKFTPLQEETLVVTTVLPSPGWWNGMRPDDIKSGFEYCLAAQIAHRAGLSRVEVRNVAWDQFISGAASGYDIAMAAVTITDERRAVMDFSAPYFASNLGVAIRAGDDVSSENIRAKRIGVLQGNMGAEWVMNTLKPDNQPFLFQSQADAVTALTAKQVDAVITDTALTLTAVKASNGALVVPGQFKLGQSYGVVLPKGSPNLNAVDEAVTSMQSDGSIADLTRQYLAPLFGGNPDEVPFWEAK